MTAPRKPEEEQLPLFVDAFPRVPKPAAPIPYVIAPAASAPPAVPAPLEELRTLDGTLDAAGPPLSPEWPVREEPSPRICTAPILVAGRQALERRAILADEVRTMMASARLGPEEREIAERLGREILPSQESWLHLVVAVCLAESVTLERVLRGGRRLAGPDPQAPAVRRRSASDVARARFHIFHALIEQLGSTTSLEHIAGVFICHHTSVSHGRDMHAVRLIREEREGSAVPARAGDDTQLVRHTASAPAKPAPAPPPPPPAPSAERAVGLVLEDDRDDGAPGPDGERWVERDPDDGAGDADLDSQRARTG